MAENVQYTPSPELRRAVLFEYGEKVGGAWLHSLPTIVSSVCTMWGLTIVGVPDSGALSCTVFVRDRGGRDMVLKIPVHPHLSEQETFTVKKFADRGLSPQVTHRDPLTGAFTIDRVFPGTSVEPVTGEDVENMIHVMEVLSCGTVPPFSTQPPLPRVTDRVQMRHTWAVDRFRQTGNEAGGSLLHMVEDLLPDPGRVTFRDVMLHGDLQPKNILRGDENTPVMLIDPLGCVGPVETDIALWITLQEGDFSCVSLIERFGNLVWVNREELARWVTIFTILELRPYQEKYRERMVTFLHSDVASGVLCAPTLGGLVDQAISVTTDPRPVVDGA